MSTSAGLAMIVIVVTSPRDGAPTTALRFLGPSDTDCCILGAGGAGGEVLRLGQRSS